MTLSYYVGNLPSEGHKKAKLRLDAQGHKLDFSSEVTRSPDEKKMHKRDMAKKMDRKYITKSVPKDGKYNPSEWELKTTSFGNGRGGTDTDKFLVKRHK
jgi:hypothetical protein